MTGIIIQSRLGSKRLPRKAFLVLAGKTITEWVVERCLETGFPVVLAVPEGEGEEYKAIIGHQCPIYEGHPTDVLDRYHEVAKVFHFDPVIRITGDCPLVDPDMIVEMENAFIGGYLSNCHPVRTVPRGMDVEIFDFEMLRSAHTHAYYSEAREHVTYHIYEMWPEKCRTYAPSFPDSWNVSIDTPEDYERVRTMVEEGKYPWLS